MMMMRRAGIVLGLTLSLLVACARHHVVERDVGRVDGKRSISSNSDTRWTVNRAPAADENEGP